MTGAATAKAAAGVAGATGVGWCLGSPMVKAGIAAAVVVFVATWALARSQDASVLELVGFCAGRALIGVFTGLAVLLVEWPLRAVHRVCLRWEIPLRLQLLTSRQAHATRLRVGGTPAGPAPVPAVPAVIAPAVVSAPAAAVERAA